MGNICIGHNYIGHDYEGHNYIGHNYKGMSVSRLGGNPCCRVLLLDLHAPLIVMAYNGYGLYGYGSRGTTGPTSGSTQEP